MPSLLNKLVKWRF